MGCVTWKLVGGIPNHAALWLVAQCWHNWEPCLISSLWWADGDNTVIAQGVLMEHAPEHDNKHIYASWVLRPVHPDTANMRNTVVKRLNNLIWQNCSYRWWKTNVWLIIIQKIIINLFALLPIDTYLMCPRVYSTLAMVYNFTFHAHLRCACKIHTSS